MAQAFGVASVAMEEVWRMMILLLVCDSEGCGRAHHMTCTSLEPTRLDFWRCDMCVIAERVTRRRRRAASGMEPINGWQRRTTVAMGEGSARKRVRQQDNVENIRLEGQLGLLGVSER